MGVLPSIAYAIARITGAIPAEEARRRGLGNHGPWYYRWSDLGRFVALGYLLTHFLLPYTIGPVSPAFRQARKLPVLPVRTALVGVRLALIRAQTVLAWTFDQARRASLELGAEQTPPLSCRTALLTLTPVTLIVLLPIAVSPVVRITGRLAAIAGYSDRMGIYDGFGFLKRRKTWYFR